MGLKENPYSRSIDRWKKGKASWFGHSFLEFLVPIDTEYMYRLERASERVPERKQSVSEIRRMVHLQCAYNFECVGAEQTTTAPQGLQRRSQAGHVCFLALFPLCMQNFEQWPTR